MSILMSFIGMMVLIAIAVLFSSNRRAINLRLVGGAFIIQFLLGAFILYIPIGQKFLGAMSSGVRKILDYGEAGTNFMFGGLVSDKMFELFGGGGFVFALRVLPAIIFFSSLVAVLYHLGIMKWVIRIIGGFISKVLGTSKAVSMSAAANIFVGQTEAPLVVKPHLARMSKSDLFAVMCGGLASIAGSVMAGLAGMGIPLPYLIAASFMAAPGGLLFAKLLVPDTEEVTETDDDDFSMDDDDEKPANVIDAAALGAFTGMKMAAGVGAMLIAFIGLIALFDGILGGIGSIFGYSNLTLSVILGNVFAPLAWLIGTPWADAQIAGSLIGQKIVLNEFVAFGEYMTILKDGNINLSDKSQAIITFALCGFANFGSIAVLLGGLSVIAPTRRHEIAQMGLKALLAGSLSNMMSAAIAGLFIGISGATVLGLS